VYRLSRWTPHLERLGIEATLLTPCTDEEWDGFRTGDLSDVYRFQRAVLRNGLRNLRKAAEADVVFLHRGVFPFGPWQRPTFERILVRLNPRLVYDFYDSIWVQRQAAYRAARSRLARWLNPPDMVDSIVRLAAAVTVSNEHLAEWARARRPDVHHLPIVVEPAGYEVREHRETEVVTLVWTGGPHNLTRLEAIGPALRRAASRAPLRLRVVSSRAADIPGVDVESLTRPWSAEEEARDLVSADVGLLPLSDDEVGRGKSPLKLIQYGAAGLPIISSPVVVDRDEFRPGEAILVADDPEEWEEAIVKLARDPALRARLGGEARRVVDRHYTYEAHADRLAALLAEVAAGPGAGSRASERHGGGPWPG
jgi:glycosyltransferase involved in cell wall biosynthesis